MIFASRSCRGLRLDEAPVLLGLQDGDQGGPDGALFLLQRPPLNVGLAHLVETVAHQGRRDCEEGCARGARAGHAAGVPDGGEPPGGGPSCTSPMSFTDRMPAPPRRRVSVIVPG